MSRLGLFNHSYLCPLPGELAVPLINLLPIIKKILTSLAGRSGVDLFDYSRDTAAIFQN